MPYYGMDFLCGCEKPGCAPSPSSVSKGHKRSADDNSLL